MVRTVVFPEWLGWLGINVALLSKYFGFSRKIRMEFSSNDPGCCILSLPPICYSDWITANQSSIEYYLISKVEQNTTSQ